jgi:hypothetical protein
MGSFSSCFDKIADFLLLLKAFIRRKNLNLFPASLAKTSDKA